jgi:hypothetical protein
MKMLTGLCSGSKDTVELLSTLQSAREASRSCLLSRRKTSFSRKRLELVKIQFKPHFPQKKLCQTERNVGKATIDSKVPSSQFDSLSFGSEGECLHRVIAESDSTLHTPHLRMPHGVAHRRKDSVFCGLRSEHFCLLETI